MAARKKKRKTSRKKTSKKKTSKKSKSIFFVGPWRTVKVKRKGTNNPKNIYQYIEANTAEEAIEKYIKRKK